MNIYNFKMRNSFLEEIDKCLFKSLHNLKADFPFSYNLRGKENWVCLKKHTAISALSCIIS